jgi:deoxyribodipyrimidine photolyase-related protein
MSKVLLIYPHQLFAAEYLPNDVDKVLLIEDPLFFGNDEQYKTYFHKQKLILHRASMRRYAQEVLWPAGYQVEYVECGGLLRSEGALERAEEADTLMVFDVVDDALRRRINAGASERRKKVDWLQTPMFYLSLSEVQAKFQAGEAPEFAEFYQWQRERFNILMTKAYKPVGGKLMHEFEGGKRLPDNLSLPTFSVYGDNDYVREAVSYVNDHFDRHYGSTADFAWPTNHEEARGWLKSFIEGRLEDYGRYDEALEPEAPWLFHAALSPMLNVGLLTPNEVIKAAIDRHEQSTLPLASLELFIREILGWREYQRGLYESMHTTLRTSNVFENNRDLTNDWYAASTGLAPIDDLIRKLYNRAYIHAAERRDLAGVAMLVSEIDPRRVYQWFSEMLIDSYDWTTVPTVYGFSQCVDGGRLAKLIPLVSSPQILARSHFEAGDWCDIWDGLISRFIDKHQEQLMQNPNMRVVVRANERMSQDKKRIIGYRADDFLASKTQQSEPN